MPKKYRRLYKANRQLVISPNQTNDIYAAGQTTVGSLLCEQAKIRPNTVAVESASITLTYKEFNNRVNRLAHALKGLGLVAGDRVAILSENRSEYMEVEFAAAKIGAIVAALNWRLVNEEQVYCVRLTSPKILIISPRFQEYLNDLRGEVEKIIVLGMDYEMLLHSSDDSEPNEEVYAEDPVAILYTSGTTGRPKGALISHRAFISRLLVFCADYGMTREDAFVAWAPMFHMASTDLSIGMLLIGGKVIQVDGFKVEQITKIIRCDKLGWLVLMPGVINRLIEYLREYPLVPRGILVIGAMPDLVPRRQLQEITNLLQSRYLNSFGSTETGIPPCSGGFVQLRDDYSDLSKTQSSFCEVKLLNSKNQVVPSGFTGEMIVRGPTLFSGYWDAEAINKTEFQDGWFRTGDLFQQKPSGQFNFVGRSKYLIKSGGENIYPAEIERVLLEDDRILDAVVVRKVDKQWGEIPVAVVATNDLLVTKQDLLTMCRKKLASYKQPKEIYFVTNDKIPRSTTGKIQRNEVENLVAHSKLDQLDVPAE